MLLNAHNTSWNGIISEGFGLCNEEVIALFVFQVGSNNYLSGVLSMRNITFTTN